MYLYLRIIKMQQFQIQDDIVELYQLLMSLHLSLLCSQ